MKHEARLVFTFNTGNQQISKTRHISAGEQFDVGRQDIHTLLDHESKAISKHHLRLRCIVFDEEDEDVAPMVYLQILSANGVILSNQDEVHFLTTQHSPRLLNTGDTIRLTSKIALHFYAQSVQVRSQARSLYNVGGYHLSKQVIGTGAFATVTTATRLSDSRQVACKMLPTSKENYTAAQTAWEDCLHREVMILKLLDHPNVISVEKIFCTPTTIHIFQELATGGDLLSYTSHGTLSEPETLCIAYQLVQAVKYLHDNNIVHRDIKPENILLTSWTAGSRIILTDFGQARDLSNMDISRMHSFVGTEGWQAPELRTTGFSTLDYGRAIDMWSLGAVSLACLTNLRPVDVRARLDDDGATLHTFLQSHFRHVSCRARSFIQDCVADDEHNRITATNAAQHSWFLCKRYKTDLEANYERAISSWIPKLENVQARQALLHHERTTTVTKASML